MEVVVGPDVGLCYIVPGGAGVSIEVNVKRTTILLQPNKLADFMHINEIQTSLSSSSTSIDYDSRYRNAVNEKSTVQFRLSGATDVRTAFQ